VNKKGGPDRRFANNPQLPVCLYDKIHFGSSSGLNEIIQVSRCGVGAALEQSVRHLAQYIFPEVKRALTSAPLLSQTVSPAPTLPQPPNLPASPRLFAYIAEEVVGPYTTEQLQALHSSLAVTDDTPCCFEGSEEWQPYARFKA
jgi:hypothetical protein